MYRRKAEPATLAFVIRVMSGASYAAFFPLEPLYAIRNWQAGSSTTRPEETKIEK
jgi:hypothetical protein